MDVALNIALVLVFVLVGGFFAAAEIALVALRPGQVTALGERGAARPGRREAARRLQPVPVRGPDRRDLHRLLRLELRRSDDRDAARAGARRLGPAGGARGDRALLVVTALVSYLSLVAGELVPKRLALQQPERVALVAAPVLDRSATLTRPLIWLLSRSTNAVVRAARGRPVGPGRRGQPGRAARHGAHHEHARPTPSAACSRDAFAVTDRVISEVMVPRTEVDFLSADDTAADAVDHVSDRPHSRYPVTGESVDDVIGFVHVRDLLTARPRPDGTPPLLRDLARPVTVVPGGKPVLDTLTLLRRGGGHLAVVIDEYGGTDGIVTVEDLVEEIVGEIQDEYDPAVPVRPPPRGHLRRRRTAAPQRRQPS